MSSHTMKNMSGLLSINKHSTQKQTKMHKLTNLIIKVDSDHDSKILLSYLTQNHYKWLNDEYPDVLKDGWDKDMTCLYVNINQNSNVLCAYTNFGMKGMEISFDSFYKEFIKPDVKTETDEKITTTKVFNTIVGIRNKGQFKSMIYFLSNSGYEWVHTNNKVSSVDKAIFENYDINDSNKVYVIFNKNGEVRTSYTLNNTVGEYLEYDEFVKKYVGAGVITTSVTNNLAKILFGHISETFYMTTHGYVNLSNIEQLTSELITLEFVDENLNVHTLDKQGRVNELGECVIFPSKYDRDWVKWDMENNRMNTWSGLIQSYRLSENEMLWTNPNLELTPLGKSSVALFKIQTLIGKTFGGHLTDEDIKDRGFKRFTIGYDTESKTLIPIPLDRDVLPTKSMVIFRTYENAADFLKHDENVQLIKDYYML